MSQINAFESLARRRGIRKQTARAGASAEEGRLRAAMEVARDWERRGLLKRLRRRPRSG